MPRGHRQVWLASLVLGASCEPLGSSNGLNTAVAGDDTDPLVVPYPTLIDFGTVPVTGEAVLRTLTLENPTDKPVTVYGHNQPIGLYDDDTSVFVVDGEPILELAPGELRDLPVRFLPVTDGRWEAALAIEPGPQTVEIVGRGSAPVLGVEDPGNVATPIGCEESVPVDIYNQGSAPLEVQELSLNDPWDVWTLAADPLPAVLAPGERLRVRYTFAPTYNGDSHGHRPATLTVHSNAPATPSEDVLLEGLALQVDGVEETFTYSPGASIDLLVVADTDGVMGLQIPRVAAAMPALVDALSEVGATLHSGVVTGASPCPITSTPFGDLNTGEADRIALLQTGLDGPSGPGSDRLGEHAVAALEQVDDGRCLDGFLRDDARLHVLLVAGDEDLSSLRPATQLASIEALAPDASRVIVSTILPTDTIGCGGTVYSASYAELAVSSEGVVIDLCSDDLSGTMVQVALASVADMQAALEHPLERIPLAGSLAVEVDGEPFSRFEYRASDQTLVFDSEDPPPAGSTVRVTYRATEDC